MTATHRILYAKQNGRFLVKHEINNSMEKVLFEKIMFIYTVEATASNHIEVADKFFGIWSLENAFGVAIELKNI